MTYEETARFLNRALNYWPTLFRGNDPEAMTQAWAVAPAEIPYAACARGVVKLARPMKLPPRIFVYPYFSHNFPQTGESRKQAPAIAAYPTPNI